MRTRLFLLLTVFLSCASASHFSGGTLSWAPANNDSAVINSTISILINQRYTWLRTTAASSCASNTILAHGVIGDVSSNVLNCFSDPALCSRFNFTGNISTLVPCSDYNTLLDIAQGHSETWTDFNVLLQGLIIGFVSTNDSWQSLALGGGQWSMMMYLNLTPRPYSGLINHSPTSSMPLVNYVALDINHTITLVIPMDDRDGDMIRCRFARSSVSWEGVAVNECAGACAFVALPSNAQLISINNACTLTVTLPSAGNYAVAVQLEDALVNSTHALSSVPLQFLLVAIDTSNSSSNCPYSPRIAGISPDFPSQNSTITVQMSVPYLFTVIAQIGCLNDTGTNITNFLSTSPHGMLRDDLPHRLTSSSYAINHTWTPTRDQFGQTLMFCTVAVDSHFYSSAPYCFQFFVDYQIEGTTDQLTHTDPTWALSTGDDTSELWSTDMSDGETTILSSTTSRTTATTTSVTTTTATTATTTTTTTSVSTSTSTTTTSVTTTTTTSVTVMTSTESSYIPLILGLGLGLGIPLLVLIATLLSCCCCGCCLGPLRTILRFRYKDRLDEEVPRTTRTNHRRIDDSSRNQTLASFHESQLKNINELNVQSSPSPGSANTRRPDFFLDTSHLEDGYSPFELGPWTKTTTSLLSPSLDTLPTDHVIRRVAPPLLPPPPPVDQYTSILVQTYEKQQDQIDMNDSHM